MFILIIQTVFTQPEFTQHVVTYSFTKGADVIAVDLDQDENMDIIAVNTHTTAEVAWWKNNGNNEFTKVTILGNINSARSVRADDINNDQYIDLVVAVYGENRIIYLENNGDETFTNYTVDADFTGAHTIDIKDVNNDGHLDILCSAFDYYFHNGEIAWWENDGQSPIGWTKNLISDRFQQSPFIYGEDMDGDNDMDVIACGELNDEILWWENDGNQNFTEHMIDSIINGIHTVIARDVDLDQDMDILAAACIGSQIAWYENDGGQNFIKHPLGYCPGALWLDATDLDNDGDRDLFGAPQGASYLAWWENPGNQQFIKHNFTSVFTQSFCIVPAMMDNDNDTDLVAIGWQSNKISWFENMLEDPATSKKDNMLHKYGITDIYPNPFTSNIRFDFSLTEQTKTTITIYDILGEKIAEIINNEVLNQGEYSINWNGLNNKNEKTNSGIYFVSFNFEKHSVIHKIIKH